VWAEVRVDAFANSANAPIRLTAGTDARVTADTADADARATADNANPTDAIPLARKDTLHHAR
jgi:hypothetical protein